MIATVSVKGQTVIPQAVRERANLNAGDQLDVGYAHGLIILRKRRPMTPAYVRSLLLSAHKLPGLTSEAETTVARAIRKVRSRRNR